MTQSIIIHKKRLMATIIICLFSVISIGIGKIITNSLNIKNNIVSEQDFLYTINQHIEQEFPSAQHHEWLKIANKHSVAFLKLNSINNNIKLEKDHISTTNNSLLTTSLSTILVNLISTAKAHIKENITNK